MGLKGFYELLKKRGFLPRMKSIEDLSGKTICIDGDMLLYKLMHAHTSGTVTSTDLIPHLKVFLDGLQSFQITPILVLSGTSSPVEKTQCYAYREQQRRRLLERVARLRHSITGECPIQDTITQATITTLTNRARKISSDLVQAIVDTLSSTSYDIRHATGEADALLISLSMERVCDMVYCDDSDMLLSGALCTVRDLRPVTNQVVRMYNRDTILACLALTSSQLIELGSLMGCDYVEPLVGVGPVRALQFIQKHTTVEAFVQSADFNQQTKQSKKRKFSLPADDECVPIYLKKQKRAIELLTPPIKEKC